MFHTNTITKQEPEIQILRDLLQDNWLRHVKNVIVMQKRLGHHSRLKEMKKSRQLSVTHDPQLDFGFKENNGYEENY